VSGTGSVVRFGLVGLACAALNVGIVWLGHHRLGAPYLVAALATCLITIPLSYFAHRSFSFAVAGRAGWAEFARFVAQQLSQFALGLALLVLTVEVGGIPPAAAMALVSVAMFVYGYLSNARWVFRVFGRR
jgi:putative flippase GtrA